MESKINLIGRKIVSLLIMALLSIGFSIPAMSASREAAAGAQEEETAQLRLRKTPVKTRRYQGREVEGEERVIGRGDSLWRILIQEKGLMDKRFGRYVVMIGSLNPHLKRPDVLQVGQTVFIPIRPDEILGIEVAAGKGETKLYRVKQGDYLYKILREQFGIQDSKEIRSTFDRVKDLNPNKKNWNILLVGEGVIFPGKSQPPAISAGEPVKPMEAVGLDYGRKLPVRENLQLLEQVIAALGNEMSRGGEETVPLQEGTIRIDRDAYPIIRNPKIEKKVILDLEGKIPASLRSKLESQSSPTPVVSMKKGESLHDAVNNLLSRLGFQSLPANRPVVIHDGGVDLHVRGEWMVAPPEESGGKQEVFIINLADPAGKTPDYLKDYLSLKGMNLKEILIPGSLAIPSPSPGSGGQRSGFEIERWPRDKHALVDALLKSFQISFSSGQLISLPLREGIRMDTKADRHFEFAGKKVSLFFRSIGDEVKKALQEKDGLRVIEIDLPALSSRDLISRLLEALGERAVYREHRFPSSEIGAKDKMAVTVSGFLLTNRSLLLTDREVPKDFHRFFSEKGLRLVHF